MASVPPVPTFPLSGVFLCPGLAIPLHIFEPRYQRMLACALADDGNLAMSQPLPPLGVMEGGEPPLHEICCLGKIVEHVPLEDGRANVLIQGITRMRIHEELPLTDGFRMVFGETMSEELPLRDLSSELADLRRGVQRLTNGEMQIPADAPVQQAVDFALAGLPLAVGLKIEMFSEPRVEARLQQLLSHLPTGGLPGIEIAEDDPRLN